MVDYDKKKKKKKKKNYTRYEFFSLPEKMQSSLSESVKYRYIEFFVFYYDSLPISFQLGVTFPLVVLDKIYQLHFPITAKIPIFVNL